MTRTRSVLLPALLVTTLLLSSQSPAAAALFSENFGQSGNCSGGTPGTYPFPAGWFLRNVDNRTPDGAVAWVNEAWEVREDYEGDMSNCVAFSTSWYSPFGQADDWMWTPLIGPLTGNTALRWRARTLDASYRDGYEVRVMTSAQGPPTGGTGAIGNQITNSTLVFSVAAEATTWQDHTVSLNAYAGQALYIGFRNNSNDKFLLVIDDVSVLADEPDLVAQDGVPPAPFTRYPDFWLGGLAPVPGVTANNAGIQAAADVVATAQWLHNASPTGGTVDSVPVASLAAGSAQALGFAAGLPAIAAASPDTLAIRYRVATSTPESDTANNTIDSAAVSVSTDELARFGGDPVGTIGIGAGNGGELGVQLDLAQATYVRALRITLGDKDPDPDVDCWPSTTLAGRLRQLDGDGEPTIVVATTQGAHPSFAGQTYELAFDAPLSLPPGHYVATAIEDTNAACSDATLPLQLYPDSYVDGATWVDWPTNPYPGWAHFEDFGLAFARMPGIALVVAEPRSLSVTVSGNGSVAAISPPAPVPPDQIAGCTSAGTSCSATYLDADQVTLTATVPPGQHVVWGGDCAAAGSTITASLTMDADRTCTAAFAGNTTATTLTSSMDPSELGQSVTFTATVAPVAPAAAVPTGQVTFFDGATPLGAGALGGSGVATFATSTLAAGTHSILAQYEGDGTYPAPQPPSNTLTQAVRTAVPALGRLGLLVLGALLAAAAISVLRRP